MITRPTVGFVSLGCPKNLVDTELMINKLHDQGVTITGNKDEASIVVINTCGFLDPAKKESMDTIGEFVKRKKEGSLKAVVVAGCMTERYLAQMQETYPEVDAFVRTGEFSQIGQIVDQLCKGDKAALEKRMKLLGETEQLKGHSEMTDFVKRQEVGRPYAYVKISEGCNRVCTFCIIPKLRGKHHSRSIEGIVDEVKQLVSNGTREVILIAQDLTSYGKDRGDGTGLLKLLEALEQVEDLHWVRLMYNYPRFFDSALIKFLAESEKFCGYIDIPFQHISDNVLKNMRRPETSFEIKRLIGELRDKIPGIALRTTLMVGFPGETDQDFAELLKFVENSIFNNMGAFTYYREKGTPSYDFENQVPEEVKKERYDKLMAVQAVAQKEVLDAFVGEEVDTMVDAFVEKTKAGLLYRGRHYGQAPEVDGMTYVLSEEELKVGEIYPVLIDKIVGEYDLIGVVSTDETEIVDWH